MNSWLEGGIHNCVVGYADKVYGKYGGVSLSYQIDNRFDRVVLLRVNGDEKTIVEGNVSWWDYTVDGLYL